MNETDRSLASQVLASSVGEQTPCKCAKILIRLGTSSLGWKAYGTICIRCQRGPDGTRV